MTECQAYGESEMPVHDWTRVDAGTFHAFHTAWITHLSETLNGGLLPPDYYIPLEPTYMAAYRGMPAYWRDVVEGKRPRNG